MNKCKKCKKTFKRKYTLSLHMSTAHTRLVKKLVCPLCNDLFSSITNLRVHVNRHHAGSQVRNGKVDRIRIDTKFVSKSVLQNGRFYGSYDESNESDEEMDIPLSQLAGQIQLAAIWINEETGVIKVIFNISFTHMTHSITFSSFISSFSDTKKILTMFNTRILWLWKKQTIKVQRVTLI